MEGTTTVQPRSRGLLATSLLVAVVCSMFTGLLAGSASATVQPSSVNAQIVAKFDCTAKRSVDVSSNKTLFNVVLVVDNGGVVYHVKYDRLRVSEGTFTVPSSLPGVLTGAYVKSGDNGSGAGPGYGEYFGLECPSPEAGGFGMPIDDSEPMVYF